MLDLLFNASNTSKLLHYDYHYDKVVSRKVPSLVQLFRLLFFSLLHSNGRNAIASHSCRYTCIMHAYQNAIINQIIYAYFFVCVLFSKYTLVSHKKTPGHFRVRGVSFVVCLTSCNVHNERWRTEKPKTRIRKMPSHARHKRTTISTFACVADEKQMPFNSMPRHIRKYTLIQTIHNKKFKFLHCYVHTIKATR